MGGSIQEGAPLPESAGVVIIGAGISGCSIAREVVKYTDDVVILDKEADVADETTKANNAEVHSGIGEKTGTLKQKLNVRGNRLYDQFVEGLGIELKRQGLLIVITPRTLPTSITRWLPKRVARWLLERVVPRLIMRNGKKKGIPGQTILTRQEIFEREPHVTRNAIAGVFDPTYGLVSPYKLAMALAESAIQNGAKLFLETEVTDVKVEDGAVVSLVTNRGEIRAPIVVNAAGVFADKVADMAGAGGFEIHPRKGASLLFDRDITADYVHSSVAEFRMFHKGHSKGGGAMPTAEGNLQLGPTAIETGDRYDTSISAEEIEEIFERFYYLLPDFPRSAIISAFSGIRAPTLDEDFIIEASDEVKGFVNVAGIQSPGLAAAPAIAEMVIGILHGLGVPATPRADFDPVRPAPPRFTELSGEERDSLIEDDPAFGHIICRCETVTEAEVVNAIHGTIPAKNMDMVKRRTRVGMGRCQGGFCGFRCAEIIARERGIPITEVTKDGGGSWVFAGETKHLLAEGDTDEAGR
ncbi:MAG TPA: NAD(P)/FAD-dependent oxidoreductase [Candidatus Anoxymicrobiaceae bacterium]